MTIREYEIKILDLEKKFEDLVDLIAKTDADWTDENRTTNLDRMNARLEELEAEIEKYEEILAIEKDMVRIHS